MTPLFAKKRIIKESEIMKEDDTKWPQKNKDGRQELEIRLGNEHISFETAKIGSLVDVTESADPEGLRVFYYLVQDLKALVFSLISLHFKTKPFPAKEWSWWSASILQPSKFLRFNDLNVSPMPTPSEDILHASHPSIVTSPHNHRSLHATCPPEEERLSARRMRALNGEFSDETMVEVPLEQQSTPSADAESSRPPDINNIDESHGKQFNTEDETMAVDGMSPLSAVSDPKDNDQQLSPSLTLPVAVPSASPSSMSYEFSSVRLIPAINDKLLPNSTSSYLRPGSKFHGTQESDRQVYDVQVEIKHVDMNESFLCGYLRIQGLTEDHPTLTTYFEGEIIGTKYRFQTEHAEWGSNEKVDMNHWNRFPAWRPLQKQAKRPDFSYKNFAQRENIFMRWKEYFLVPDHRVRTISGASFEGFYYICFNQVAGTVSGIYFHAKSEKYQQLELKHVDDRGCSGAVEFR
ncbi:MAG: hypothetical protein M1827_003300 [Pycnora praestabilis]|nr:MAG: hypothetical protein M1827_003300 [Pycnora praestabilis]